MSSCIHFRRLQILTRNTRRRSPLFSLPLCSPRIFFHRAPLVSHHCTHSSSSFPSLCVCRRWFQTIQKGYDTPAASLFSILGLEDFTKSRHRGKKIGEGGIAYDERVMHCSEKDITQAFLFQVSQLKDPVNNEEEKNKLQELKSALQLLLDPRYRAQYRSHYSCSADAQLHILLDGGEVGANYNPEHQQFSFFDHSRPFEATGDEPTALPLLNGEAGATLAGSHPHHSVCGTAGGVGGGTQEDDASCVPPSSSSPAAWGTHASSSSSSPSAPPRRGGDIAVTLRLSFEEGWAGGPRSILLENKEVKCGQCEGTGKEGSGTHIRPTERGKKRCPQCFGRGHVILPSATYHIQRPCTFCLGNGTSPPRPCGSCQGKGVVVIGRPPNAPLFSSSMSHVGTAQSSATQDGVGGYRVSVTIPPCTTAPVTTFCLRGKGHSGRYGGPPGDVHLTLLVAEHRYFFYQVVSPPVSSSAAVRHRWHVVLPIALTTALLGGRVRVPHPCGRKNALRRSPSKGMAPLGSSTDSVFSCSRGEETFSPFASEAEHQSIVVAVPPGVYNGYPICVPLRASPLPSSSVRDSGKESKTSASSSWDQELIVHVLVMVPKGLSLTARQQAALRVFEEEERKRRVMEADVDASLSSTEEEEEEKEKAANDRVAHSEDYPACIHKKQRREKQKKQRRQRGAVQGEKKKMESTITHETNLHTESPSEVGEDGNHKRESTGKEKRAGGVVRKNGGENAMRNGGTAAHRDEEEVQRLWEECATLKSKYRHWLRVP